MNEVPKLEQFIAALTGLLTAGPIGSVAAWRAIVALRGKWTPWLLLGVPSACAINVIQLVAATMLLGPFIEVEKPQPPTILTSEPEVVYDI